MVSGFGTEAAGAPLAVGSRVWLLHEGWTGRIVACAQGGLLYRVRREGAPGTVVLRPGCDLLPLHPEPPA